MDDAPEKPKTRKTEAIKKFCVLVLLIVTVALTSLNVLPDLIANFPVRTWQLKKSDVIIVLGTPANRQGKAGPTLRERILKGIELLKADYAKHIIFTGASAHNEFVEADVMADLAKSNGVEEDQIVREPRAQNTPQNAFESVAIMRERGWKSAIVVTSQAHTRRSNYIFSHYPIDYCVVGCEDPPEQSLYDRIVFDQREKFYLLGALVTGQSSTFGLNESQVSEFNKLESSTKQKKD